MLHDLLATDLGFWHPRQIVKTAALREQQQHSLSGEDEWWLGLLQEGVLPRHEISAHSNPRRARSCDLLDHARKSGASPATSLASCSWSLFEKAGMPSLLRLMFVGGNFRH
jgi:hypothetical protein